MKNQFTKRALFGSLASLGLSAIMMVGTTFAWFTDSAESKGNIIKTGSLEVGMSWAKATEDPTLDTTVWTDASAGAIFNNDKWEPGYVEAKHIKIENLGTLALQYSVSIVATGTVSDLSDAIDVYYVDPAVQVQSVSALTDENKLGTLTDVLANLENTASGVLLEGKKDTVTLALKMREDAGNEYQNKSIGTSFAVQLFATQYTYEEDSFGNDYDANAPYILPTGMTAEDFGTNVANVNGQFYKTLKDALMAVHNGTGTENTVYVKPGADLGTITHAHVCKNLTVYGNDAYVSGGERDFEIGFPAASSTACTGISSELTLNVYNLHGCAVWGSIQATHQYDINVNLYDCKDVTKVMLLKSGDNPAYQLNISINNCTFTGTSAYRDSAIYCQNLSNLNVSNTTFQNYAVGINQNNKDGVERYTLTNCTFIDCATSSMVTTQTSYAAPVRAVASVAGTTTYLVMNGCQFVYTTTEKAINGNLLIYQDGNAGTVYLNGVKQ